MGIVLQEFFIFSVLGTQILRWQLPLKSLIRTLIHPKVTHWEGQKKPNQGRVLAPWKNSGFSSSTGIWTDVAWAEHGIGVPRMLGRIVRIIGQQEALCRWIHSSGVGFLPCQWKNLKSSN